MGLLIVITIFVIGMFIIMVMNFKTMVKRKQLNCPGNNQYKYVLHATSICMKQFAPGMWKRLDLVPLPALPLPLPLPKCSTNTSSYHTHQVEAPLPLPHP